ncbi:hypothetical protein JCGZ_22325 [Jatropha curcas]|uniref:Aminotransferase-like plant mobile domain-containing protein n=1 Tax=Jatropha curcas TaxID=180498 RepID=A0A067JU31_JATCU|nr:hypothetical protein JCGZ_22325 [Jatropha curcas]
MTSPGHSSDEDFLESLGISLDTDLTAEGIPFGIRPVELYNDWRTEVSPDRMVELIGIDRPRIVGPGSATPALSTWAFEYFSYTRLELIHADLGLGLVPPAWRWYRTILHTIRHKKSLRDLRAFFDTCSLDQVEVGPMTAHLQSWIQADPHFQRSDALSRRRVVLSHPILRQYYLGERVDLQIRGCRPVPYSPPEYMRAGKQMMLTDAHTGGVPHMEFILGEITPSSAKSF